MAQKILLGPAGSCGLGTLEGVRFVKEHGLQAMEVEFVRGVKMGLPLAQQVGQEAKRLGIELSVHAPYYVNLCSEDKKKIADSKVRILASCERGHAMGARHIVFHPGYYGKLAKEQAYTAVLEAMLDMQRMIEKKDWNVLLAPETTGKVSALGDLDETIRLAKDVGCSLCLDPAHLFARASGKLDFKGMFDKVAKLKLKHLHTHFSGITYTAKGERYHVPINGKPDFMAFAKEILKRKLSATIIAESPITWRDSIKMRGIFERLGYRFG